MFGSFFIDIYWQLSTLILYNFYVYTKPLAIPQIYNTPPLKVGRNCLNNPHK